MPAKLLCFVIQNFHCRPCPMHLFWWSAWKRALLLSMGINRLGGPAGHTFPELTEGSSHQTSWFNLVAAFPPPSLGDKTALFTSETFYMQAQDGLSQRPGWSATAHLPKFIRHNDLLKEWITCPCIQRLSLTSSHVLWTPRKVWHNRDVPQGWHPHATSSSDCSPTAVLQTFPALPAPD